MGFSKPSPSFQIKLFSKKGGRCLLTGRFGETRLGFRFTMSGSSKEPHRLRIGRTEAKKRCSPGEGSIIRLPADRQSLVLTEPVLHRKCHRSAGISV